MSELEQRIKAISEEALSKIGNAETLDVLNDLRVTVLGKKGSLTALLKGMKDVAPEDRPKVGQLVNEARDQIEARLAEVKEKIEANLKYPGTIKITVVRETRAIEEAK